MAEIVGAKSLIIIDTDVIIDYMRGIEKARGFFSKHSPIQSLAISVITQLELIAGCRNKNDVENLSMFLSIFEIIPLNEGISDLCVELFLKYKLSHNVKIPDMIIAATAIELNRPLYSKNHKDFKFIKNLMFEPY